MRRILALGMGGLLAALAAPLAPSPVWAANAEHSFAEYRVIDGGRLWVQGETGWRRLRLAHIDAPFGSGNRPLTRRISSQMPYSHLRYTWVRWIRQTGVLAEGAREEIKKKLLAAKERSWREVAEPPKRRSHTKSGTMWVRIELDGDDLGQSLLESGWAIAWVPPTMPQSDDWERLNRLMRKAMGKCRGMWQSLLISCASGKGGR